MSMVGNRHMRRWMSAGWTGIPWILLLLLLAAAGARAQEEEANDDPIRVNVKVVRDGDSSRLHVGFFVPAQHHIYADALAFRLGTADENPALPKPVWVEDRFNGGRRLAFETNFEAVLALPAEQKQDLALTVNYQGCNEESCFFPQERHFLIHSDGTVVDFDGETAAPPASASWLHGLRVTRRATGYLDAHDFLGFLRQPGKGGAANQLSDRFTGKGRILVLGLILLGGLALNLTPCVLPMIPITLAILGAGAQSKSKGQGFALGAIYGLGMAFVFGIAGAGRGADRHEVRHAQLFGLVQLCHRDCVRRARPGDVRPDQH